ncbi:MAG: hypothetical protein P8L68_13460 [Paracoccaceae bacterium]|nr:hypothetical protein [Paracoccaceae bacterium]
MTETLEHPTEVKAKKPRILLGERATAIAASVADGDRVNQDHLEEAIRRLQETPKSQNTSGEDAFAKALHDRFDALEDIIDEFEERHQGQLLMLNKALITLGHVIRASAAKRSEEVEISLGELRERMFEHQISEAKTSELNVSELVEHNQNLAAFQRDSIDTGLANTPSKDAIER